MTYRFGGMVASENRTKGSRFWNALPREWVTVLLSFITLEIAILSIERAKWLQSQPSLTFVLILSMLAGVALVKWRINRPVRWCLVIAGGILVTAWQTLVTLPPSQLSWYERLGNALESVWGVITMAQTDASSIHFVIFLVLFTWFLGYASTRFVLRRQNAWGVVIPGVIVLLINLSNLPENYYGYLVFFLVAAALLVGQTRLMKNNSLVTTVGKNSAYSITRFFASSVLSIGILAAAVTWFTPDIQPGRIASVNANETPILENIKDYLDNLLARIPRKQPLVSSEDQSEYLFTGNYERSGDEVHFIISSDSPQYWRTWVYDVYTSSGWQNSDIVESPPEQESADKGDSHLNGREEISYDVEVRLKTDILLTAGQLLSSDVPVSRHALAPFDSTAPDEQFTSERTITAVLPYNLDSGQRYGVTSSVISATPLELANAGEDYPAYIEHYYLQLPDTLPDRVREFSENVTANATTPYEKVMAISDNLSQFIYSLKTPPPPKGTDAVEFFCFSEQSGACADFASAMVVLLRSAGVPARFCTGYQYGELDPDSGKYVVRISDRHAWAEVYFPGYGWVEFEATPGSSTPRGIVGVEAFTGGGTTEVWDPYLYMEPFLYPSSTPSSTFTAPDVSLDTTSVFLVWPFIFLAVGIPLAGILYFVYFRWGRSRNRRLSGSTEYESEVYAGMCELAAQADLGPLPHQTPLEYSAQLAAEFPGESGSINLILQAFLERRYGRERVSERGEEMNWRLMRARRLIFDAIRERLKEKGKRV